MDNLVNRDVIDRIAAAARSSVSFNDLGLAIVQELGAIMPIERMNIGLIDTDEYMFTDVFVTGSNLPCRPTGHMRTLHNTVVEASMVTNRPIFIGDEPQECLVERFPNLKLTFDTGIRSIIAVAVRLEDEFIGAMVLASVRSLAYTGEDLDMVYHVSTIIGERIAAMKNIV